MDINSASYLPDKEAIRSIFLELGFEACGFAAVDIVGQNAIETYNRWIEDGNHGTMEYLARNADVRNNPELLHPGARTIIAVALNYYPKTFQPSSNPRFAYYAYGRDYHKVLKKKLKQAADILGSQYGGTFRACVDSAPLRERYWAQKAGIGFVGKNNMLIIPGKGSFFFLGFLITTLAIKPDAPCTESCIGCNKCINACPGSALSSNCAADARKCISYLTIEYRGNLQNSQKLHNNIYGCDTCQLVCPHNSGCSPTGEQNFTPNPELFALTAAEIADMTDEIFESTFSGSAIRRISLQQLKRNLNNI